MLKIIEVSKIRSGKNIRDEKDTEILELMASIEKQGLMNPIFVRKTENNLYEVIAGHRRFEAVRRLGLPHIECNIAEDMSERDILSAQIAENVQRKNMSAFELVKIFDDLKMQFNLKQKQIASMFGKTEAWVSTQYQAVKFLNKQYDSGEIPEDEKRKTSTQINYSAKKKIKGESEIFLCKGMKVKISGHSFSIYCECNNAENELRKFIEERKL